MRTLIKNIKILVLLTCSFFINCDIDSAYEDFGPEDGIAIEFYNYTDIEYNSYKFYIGAVKNDKFIATDSVDIKTTIWSINTAPSDRIIIDSKGDKSALSYDGFKEDLFIDGRWQVDFEKIKAISNEFTYKLILSDRKEQVFMENTEKIENFKNGLNRVEIKTNALIYVN